MKAKSINTVPGIAAVVLLALVFMAFALPQDQKKGAPCEIPSKYVKMENPYAGGDDLVRVDEMIYSKHCKSFQGNKGLVDGLKANQLETFPGNFSSEEFKAGTDGELYYKSIIRRGEMPNYEKKITNEEDRWAIINYLKTLK